jgi:hypothetical protein
LVLPAADFLIEGPGFSRAAHPHEHPCFSHIDVMFRGVDGASKGAWKIPFPEFEQDSSDRLSYTVFHTKTILLNSVFFAEDGIFNALRINNIVNSKREGSLPSQFSIEELSP